MSVIGLDHIQIAMPSGKEDEAVSFYEGILGIPQIDKPIEVTNREGCWFERGLLKVHLGVDPEFHPARKAHPGFEVDDLATLVTTLRAQGFVVSEEPPLANYTRFFTSDPFDNRIELLEKSNN